MWFPARADLPMERIKFQNLPSSSELIETSELPHQFTQHFCCAMSKSSIHSLFKTYRIATRVSRLTSFFNILLCFRNQGGFLFPPTYTNKSGIFSLLTGTVRFLISEVELEAQSAQLPLCKSGIQGKDRATHIQKRMEKQTVSLCRPAGQYQYFLLQN